MSKEITTTPDEKLSFALAQTAKLLGSGVFVVGRDPDEFLEHDLKDDDVGLEGPGVIDWSRFSYTIDREAGLTTASQDEFSRSSVYTGGQGCVILPPDGSGLRFTPVPVTPNVPDPATTPWPMGDLLPDMPLPPGVDQAALEATLDWAFDDGRQPCRIGTRGVVVCYQGRIIAERYAPGFDQDTRQISWSAGKSITAALVGLLVKDGCFTINDYAPIEEWKGLDDPRRMIRIRHLLNMSSGLHFRLAGDGDPETIQYTPLNQHGYIYYEGIDVFDLAVNVPLEFVPGSYWRYRNCDPLSLGAIVRRTVDARGEEYLTCPQRALFDKIGARSFVLETDPWGNFILTGYDYGTPRDWARFGLLHLWEGSWKPTGEQLLTPEWVEAIRTPAPADHSRGYGGQFWLNAGGRYPNCPRDLYHPAGLGGQVSMIIPSRDVVIARLGHPDPRALDRAELPLDKYFDQLVSRILAAIGPS